MVFFYGSPSRLTYACFTALPKGTNKSIKNKKKKTPSIPKLSKLVWKAIQKSASFNSIQPRVLRLEKSSPVFSTSSPQRGRKQEKKGKKEHKLVCPSLLQHYDEVVLASEQPD